MTSEPLERWEGIPTARLAESWGVPHVQAYDAVGSTNDVARKLAQGGAPHGACVLAEEQVAGRGRERRSWSSPPHLGVWMSMILPPRPGDEHGLLPIAIGVAVASALDPFCKPSRVEVKWPNDLLLDGRKVGGILCEATWEGGRSGGVIAGIGLNVLHSPEDFPPELRGAATSIRIASGWNPPRAEVAGAVARAVHAVSSTTAFPPELFDELARRDALHGRRILLTGASPTTVQGTAAGIDRDGSLRIRTDDGALLRFRTGTVRLAESA